MDRRALIGGLVLGTLAVSRLAHAQPARKVYRIGVLTLYATADAIGPEPRNTRMNAFLRGLRELGYVYGEHFVTEVRGAEGRPERYSSLAAELVRLRVDVIVAPGPALAALKQATPTIPIVMGAANDPVGDGLVQSLARPGGNITGLSLQSAELAGKRLELLKEVVPSAAPTAVLWSRYSLQNWQETQAAARQRGWKLVSLEIQDASEIDRAFKVAADARAGALLVFASGPLVSHRRRIAELAARSRLPAMYELRLFVDDGGLMSYSADLVELWRRAAAFVDKILKGANPADLPVEQAAKFELVINLKAAKALGLTIPPLVLARADEVIQ
jgi:putative ABC transport system substrate-binding protein